MKEEFLEYGFKTDMNDLIKDINKERVDAFLLDGINLLEIICKECPTMSENYVVYPLYDSTHTLNLPYFTVSSACEEKQFIRMMYVHCILFPPEPEITF